MPRAVHAYHQRFLGGSGLSVSFTIGSGLIHSVVGVYAYFGGGCVIIFGIAGLVIGKGVIPDRLQDVRSSRDYTAGILGMPILATPPFIALQIIFGSLGLVLVATISQVIAVVLMILYRTVFRAFLRQES